MTYLNLLWSDFIKCYLTQKRRNTSEKKKQPESSESLPHLTYPVLPSPPPPPLHQIHNLPEYGRDTDTETQFVRQKNRKGEPNPREGRKEAKKKRKQPVEPSPSPPHLTCFVQHPPPDLSTSYSLPGLQSGTRINETVYEIKVGKPGRIATIS